VVRFFNHSSGLGRRNDYLHRKFHQKVGGAAKTAKKSEELPLRIKSLSVFSDTDRLFFY